MDVYVDQNQHRVSLTTDAGIKTRVTIDEVRKISLSALETDEEDEPYPTYWRTLTVQTREGTIEIEFSATERAPLTVKL